MTFTQIKTRILNFCGLTSTDADTRVGIAINAHYRRVTAGLGLEPVRFVTRAAATSDGVRTLRFTDIEKVDRIIDVTGDVRLLTETSIHEIRSMNPAEGEPSTWAIQNSDADSVLVVFDTIPDAAYSLQADGTSTIGDMSGSDEPAFSESFHDILSFLVISEEVLKKEKIQLAREFSSGDEERPGRAETAIRDLRFKLADSPTLETRQASASVSAVSGGSGAGGVVSESLTFTQEGTGATLRTVQSKLREWMSVTDFGATGDGTTDDSAAIQLALNVALTTAQTLYFPTGTYKVATGLTTLGGVRLKGEGRPYTRIKYTGAGGACLTIQAAGYQHTNIEDLTIEDGGSGSTIGIDVNYTFVHLQRVTIGAFDGGTRGFTTGLRFREIGVAGKTFDNTIRDCYFNGTGNSGTTTAIQLDYTDYTLIEGTRVDAYKTGIKITTGQGNQVIATSIQGEYATHGDGHVGIDLDAASSTLIHGCKFETERLENASATGARAVRIGAASGTAINTTVESCWINGCGVSTKLIEVTGSSQHEHLFIANNRFHRATTAIAVPTGGLAEVSLGRNEITSVTNLVTVNGVALSQNDYSAYYGAAPLALGYQKAIRHTSSGGTSDFETITRTTSGGVEGVLIAGSGDVTQIGAAVGFKEVTLTYSTTIATNAALGRLFRITVTDGVAFTISNPTAPTNGALITYTIRNTSGGAVGTITWGAAFKMAAWTSPATANNRSVTFKYDSTDAAWVELSRTTADIPN